MGQLAAGPTPRFPVAGSLASVRRGRSILGFAVALVALAMLDVASSATATSALASGPLPRCATAGLDIWVYPDEGGGTAGGFYYHIAFTNFSGRACALRGEPGVVAADIHGRRIGSPTSPGAPAGAPTVRIPAGGTVTSLLKVVDPGVFAPSVCRPVLAAGLRVRPPGDSTSRFVPLPVEVCSRPGHSNLEVWEVKSG